jgi:hypothetical protein
MLPLFQTLSKTVFLKLFTIFDTRNRHLIDRMMVWWFWSTLFYNKPQIKIMCLYSNSREKNSRSLKTDLYRQMKFLIFPPPSETKQNKGLVITALAKYLNDFLLLFLGITKENWKCRSRTVVTRHRLDTSQQWRLPCWRVEPLREELPWSLEVERDLDGQWPLGSVNLEQQLQLWGGSFRYFSNYMYIYFI